jgi:hypothetical protein
MDTGQAVSIWRCECGKRLKAITEFDPDKRQQQRVVCPTCGREQLIDGSKVISVSEDTSPLGVA